MSLHPTIIILSLLVLTGCSTVAPQYQAGFENTQRLEDFGNQQAAVDRFSAADEKVNNLTIRGGSFVAPTNESYVEYLQKAVEQELYDAKRLDTNADVKVGGVLMENEIDASGFSVGTARMKAEFSVSAADGIRYRKIHSASIEWPSNFVGAIAIPRAIKEYPRVVQELLTSLFSDPEFNRALNR